MPFIATLAMFAMARGLALWISDKTPISLFDLEGVRWFGNGEVVGIPSAVIVFLAVTALGWILLNRTRYGRHVVAVGGNREAARIAGVKVRADHLQRLRAQRPLRRRSRRSWSAAASRARRRSSATSTSSTRSPPS